MFQHESGFLLKRNHCHKYWYAKKR